MFWLNTISNIHKVHKVVLHFDVIVWLLAEFYTVYQLPDMQHNHNNNNIIKKHDGKKRWENVFKKKDEKKFLTQQ